MNGSMFADHVQRRIREVSSHFAKAEALLITAGAGMGVDSGLPDYRGNRGFWRAYPPLEKLGISFERMAQPHWFVERPKMAWAWYGHRAQLYRQAAPHAGYRLLREWLQAMPACGFVVTSNVDGQFLKADFEERGLHELHGSIHHLQCVTPCGDDVWSAELPDLQIDLDTLSAEGELPRCPHCGALARPNVLMFNDTRWVDPRASEQGRRFEQWLARVRGRRLMILEIGAGTAVPTIRTLSERIAQRNLTTLVRVNPDAMQADDGIIAIPLGALEALNAISQARKRVRRPLAVAATRPGQGESPAMSAPPTERRAPQVTLRLPLAGIHFVDLMNGYLERARPEEIDQGDEMALLHAMAASPSAWFPIPVTSVHSPCGYQMGLHVLGDGGAALVSIHSQADEAVLSFAIGRRAEESALLWKSLYASALLPLQPLDRPETPWIARRVETDSPDHRPMISELAQVGRIAAIAWLNFRAFQDGEWARYRTVECLLDMGQSHAYKDHI